MTQLEKTNQLIDLESKSAILTQLKTDYTNLKGSDFRGISLRTAQVSVTLNSYIIDPIYTGVVDSFIDALIVKIDAEITILNNYKISVENTVIID